MEINRNVYLGGGARTFPINCTSEYRPEWGLQLKVNIKEEWIFKNQLYLN